MLEQVVGDRTRDLAVVRFELDALRRKQRDDAASLYLIAISLALCCVVVSFVAGKKRARS